MKGNGIMYGSQILGTGSYLPTQVLSNLDLERSVDTNNEWILERTGISTRHIAAPNEAPSDLGFKAAEAALQNAGCGAEDIECIIFATVTPDQMMPSSACCLQAKLKQLGGKNLMAFDLSAACSGFLYGLVVGDQFIKTGLYKKVLVVGSEALSRFVDYKDRATCILFGDGAGAVILGRAPADGSAELLASSLCADGAFGDLLAIPAGGSRLPASHETIEQRMHYITMKGREIFKSAVRAMVLRCQEAMERAHVTCDQIDWFVPHQANARIIASVGASLQIDPSKVITNLIRTGNTSSASIPMAFDEGIRNGRIQRGQTILMGAFGGGLTSGAVVLRY